MKVTFLGTGTSQGVPVVACNCEVCKSDNPHDKRLRSSVLIEIDNQQLVIDAGPDFRQQMLNGIVNELRAILITHEHYDHIAGLDDIRAYNWVQGKPTDIYAEARVHKSIKRIFSYVFSSNKYPGIPQMNLNEVKNKPFYIDNTEIIPIRGLHYKLPVLGYKIRNFVYLTDFKSISNEERNKIRHCKVLVVNALRKEKHLSHFTLEEALALIEDIQPKQAYLTHMSHLLGKHSDISNEIPENVSPAYDNLTITI